jgi:hypothetical protein
MEIDSARKQLRTFIHLSPKFYYGTTSLTTLRLMTYTLHSMFTLPRKFLLRSVALLMVVSLGMMCLQAVTVHSHADNSFDHHCAPCKSSHALNTGITAVPLSIEMTARAVERVAIQDESEPFSLLFRTSSGRAPPLF